MWNRPSQVEAQALPQGYAASNFETIAYSETDGRPGFKMAIREVNGRWYMYMGHLWHRGWTVEQTEDVLVDRRGYVYVTNKNQGLWILRYTGPRPTATN